MKSWVLVGLLILLAAQANAGPHSVGDRLEAFVLEDQHGTSHQVDESTRVILFSRDMDGGKLLKEALSEMSEDDLRRREAVYVADISGMPKFVAKLFALPSMRKRPHPVLLDRDGRTTARFPDLEGRATLIFLRDLEMTRVEHMPTASEVLRALGE